MTNEVSFQLSGSPDLVLLLQSTEAKALLSCLGGWGTSDKGPLREGEGARACRCEVTVCQPGPGAAASLLQRLSTGLICGFWKRNSLLIMSNSKPPPRSLLGAHRELQQSVLPDLLELRYELNSY